jgi:hypothetical protein
MLEAREAGRKRLALGEPRKKPLQIMAGELPTVRLGNLLDEKTDRKALPVRGLG